MAKVNWQSFKTSYRVFARHTIRYKKEAETLFALSLLSALGNSLVPYFAGKIIDKITSPGTFILGQSTFSTLWLVVILWFSIQILNAVINKNQHFLSEAFGNHVYSDYITKSYSKLLRLSLTFHKKNKIGEVVNKVSRAADHIYNIVVEVIGGLGPQFISIFIALAVTFIAKPIIGFIMVAGILVYFLLAMRNLPSGTSLRAKMETAYNRAFGDAYDAIINTAEVKQATAENHEAKHFEQRFLDEATGHLLKLFAVDVRLRFYRQLIIVSTQFFIFIFSINLIQLGEMSIGQLVMVNSYAAMVFGPFTSIANFWQRFARGMVTVNNMEKIITLPEENYFPSQQIRAAKITGHIKFENVSFAYEKKKPVLKNISFEIRPGETAALVGESGVGKSTLIDLISGYTFPTRGHVFIDGVETSELALHQLRQAIAVVPQEVVLFNDRIDNNIKYGNFRATKEQVVEAATEAGAHEFIEKFPKKWRQEVGDRGIRLSVGQKQRIAIARAILRNPRILILDEPTSALDAKTEKFISESLDKLMQGRTTIIIAHRLSTVKKADKIIVLRDGGVAGIGRHEELITKKDGLYRELYEYQIGLQ